jgi:hypothetical protein
LRIKVVRAVGEDVAVLGDAVEEVVDGVVGVVEGFKSRGYGGRF